MDVFPFNADVLFLPFKLKANTTLQEQAKKANRLFLPFKLKANTTLQEQAKKANSCFYLSN